VVIVSANGTDGRVFESRQGEKFLGIYTIMLNEISHKLYIRIFIVCVLVIYINVKN
jgi:hypothetical protein